MPSIKLSQPLSVCVSLSLSHYCQDKSYTDKYCIRFWCIVVVQLLIWSDSAIPWTAERQASLSFTISWSLLKPMSIESVMLTNHLILCHPLLLLPSGFHSLRVFFNDTATTEIYTLSLHDALPIWNLLGPLDCSLPSLADLLLTSAESWLLGAC